MKTITASPKITVFRPSGPFNASNATEFQQHLIQIIFELTQLDRVFEIFDCQATFTAAIA